MFEIAQLAPVTQEMFKESQKQRISNLNVVSFRGLGYVDASIANNTDFSTQLGHICFIEDETGSVILIPIKSYKWKNVMKSTMVGKVIVFSDLFDVTAVLAAEAGMILGCILQN